MKAPLVLFKEAANLLWKSKGFFIKNQLLLLLVTLLTLIPVAVSWAIIIPFKNLWATIPVVTISGLLFLYLTIVLSIFKDLINYHIGNNTPKTFSEMFKRARTLVVPYLIAIILSSLLILVGFVLLAIPGIIAAVYLSFAIQAVIVSNVSGVNSLSYSYNLVKNRWWKTLWYFIAPGLLPLALQILAVILLVIVGSDYETLLSIPLGIVNTIFGAIYAVYIYLVYSEFLKYKAK